MNESYLETVRLLLAVAPSVFKGGGLALKGGTAINLFLKDVPRLSVDLDVVFTDHTRDREGALRSISELLADAEDELSRLGYTCEAGASALGDEVKLFISRGNTRVKVEVNYVFRGTLRPVAEQPLSVEAQDLFFTDLAIPILHREELYGSKLVAAMDRQHPRDLFDVLMLYESDGLTPGIVECFVSYLAGHNRPMHEVLFANEVEITRAFENEFAGMTRDPVSLEELLSIRRKLFSELPAMLTGNHRSFLTGLAELKPDWSLMSCPHLAELPAIRWKLANLERLRQSNAEKFSRQAAELRERF